jgi:hypothetical protein
MTRDGNKSPYLAICTVYLDVEVPTPNELDRSGEKK